MNCVLLQNNIAHEIWSNTTKAQLIGKFTTEILNSIVETPNLVGLGFTWDGSIFQGQRWLIITASGQFISGGFYNPIIPDASHSVVHTNTIIPNIRTQKWDGNSVINRTAQEISDYDTVEKQKLFTTTSRHKNILADAAARVRSRNITAWNNMTIQQKKDNTILEADAWIGIRQFIEDYL